MITADILARSYWLFAGCDSWPKKVRSMRKTLNNLCIYICSIKQTYIFIIIKVQEMPIILEMRQAQKKILPDYFYMLVSSLHWIYSPQLNTLTPNIQINIAKFALIACVRFILEISLNTSNLYSFNEMHSIYICLHRCELLTSIWQFIGQTFQCKWMLNLDLCAFRTELDSNRVEMHGASWMSIFKKLLNSIC